MADPVAIWGKPRTTPRNLVLTRANDGVKAQWAVPVGAADDGSHYRFEWVDCYIYCNASKNMAKSGWTESSDAGRHVTGDRIWVRGLGATGHEHTQNFDRARYHPQTDGRYLNNMAWEVFGGNWRGQSTHVKATYNFYAPRAPKMSDPVLDESTGKLSLTITPDATGDAYDRYDTRYRVVRQDNFTSTYASAKPVINWTNSTNDTIDVETDVAEATAVQAGKWVKITFEAFSRGVKGNSSTTKKTYVFAHPPVATIKGVKVSSLNVNGVVTVLISTNQSTNAPVDTVKLERLISAVPTTAGADASSGWTEVSGAEDNGNSQGLVDSVSEALPPRGQFTYYRVVTIHGGITRRTSAYKATALVRSTLPSTDDTVVIASLDSGEDGTSLVAQLAWANDDSTGTEVSWSEFADAWESTSQPSTYDVTWKDATSQVSGYPNSATLVIRGLTMGKPYYVKARRFLDDGTDKTYAAKYGLPQESDYPIAPYTIPSAVYLDVPVYLKRGSDLEVTWKADGESVPTAWILYRVMDNDSRVVVESGEDSYQATVLSSSVLEEMLSDGSTDGKTLRFQMSVTVGGDWVDSTAMPVTIQDPPTLTVATNGRLLSQPVQFMARVDEPNVYLTYQLSAIGVSSPLPDKMVMQVEGDTIHSERVVPIWYPSSDGKYYGVVTLPEDLVLFDSASYRIEATATSSVTGLSSDKASYDFQVAWLHQARRPADTSEIQVDRDSLSVRIIPAAPENVEETDVVDVYRVSPEGVELAAGSVQYGAEIVDKLAPFTKRHSCYYRLVTRTKDGDVDWLDLEYDLKGYQMRFDWGESDFLELPFDVDISSAFTKDYEAKSHIDGSVTGYWNDASTHDDTLKTKILRLSDPETIERVIEMGRYPGPIFVRLPNGSAYTANVTVSSVADTFNTQVMNVSLKANEIGMVDQYRIRPEWIEYPDGYEPPEPPTYAKKQILQWNQSVPSDGAVYTLSEEPDDDVVVKLTTSYDFYANPWTIPATNDGAEITLGQFGSDLEDYIEELPEGTYFLLMAYYDA